MLFRNPLGILGRILIRGAVRHLNLPVAMNTAFSILISTSSTLITSFGFIPVMRVLFRIPRFILETPPSRRTVQNITTRMRRSLTVGLFPLNIYILEHILLGLTPEIFGDCLKYVDKFVKIYRVIFLPFVLFSSFTPFVRWFVKGIVGLTFGSLGIVFSDSLASIGPLKSAANYFLDFLGSFSPFSVSGARDAATAVTNAVEGSEVKNLSSNTADVLTALGFALAGLTILLGVLLAADCYFPEQVHSIPYVNTIVDSVHNFVSYLFSSFGGGSAPDLDAASTVTGSSSRTITPADIILADNRTSTINATITALPTESSIPSAVLSAQASTQMSNSAAFNSMNNF